MTVALNYGVEMYTRAEWGARPPKSTTRLEANMSTDHYEGPAMGTFPHSSCAAKVRAIQNFHMDSRHWEDIAYSGIACPHGYVFEGRGPGRRTAANGTSAGNSSSYATCALIGVGDVLTEPCKRAIRAFDDYMTYVGSRRVGHRDWKATACPGDPIYTWVHNGQPIQGDQPDPDPEPGPITEVHDLMPYSTIAVSDEAAAPGSPTHRYWAVLKPGQVMFAADWDLPDPDGDGMMPVYNDPEAATARVVRIDSAGYWAGLYGGTIAPPKKLEATLQEGALNPEQSAALYDAIVWLVAWTSATTFRTPA